MNKIIVGDFMYIKINNIFFQEIKINEEKNKQI